MKRNEESFVEFATSIERQLRRTAYLACGDWDRAADHVQEALVRIYVAWPRLERQGHEHAYARKVLMNVVIDHGRRRSSTETPVDTGVEHTGVAGHEQVADHADQIAQRSTLMSVLATLQPRQRACLVLRYFEDLSVTDTAAALGVSEGTVKSQTSRALEKVRTRLDDTDSAPRCTHELSVAPATPAWLGASR